MAHFQLHPKALCSTDPKNIGQNTRIWAFANILEGAVIGKECNICDGVFIEGDVVVGDRVTVKCGVQLWDGVRLEDDVFVGPNATFTNDHFPRSGVHPQKFLKTIVRSGASLGANCTILPGIEIGSHAMIGAGAVVTKSVPPNAIVMGNPARITGYADTKGVSESTQSNIPDIASTKNDKAGVQSLGVGNSTLVNHFTTKDLRGELTVGEFEKDIPFVPKRFFTVYGVPSRETRGEHAHKVCDQFLVCVKGSCSILLDDGKNRAEVLLDRPGIGVYMPARIWGTQYKHSADAVLLVFASHLYDPDDYIREYEEFVKFVADT